MDSVIIRKIDLPIGVDGITVLDENGDYNMYLNDGLAICRLKLSAMR